MQKKMVHTAYCCSRLDKSTRPTATLRHKDTAGFRRSRSPEFNFRFIRIRLKQTPSLVLAPRRIVRLHIFSRLIQAPNFFSSPTMKIAVAVLACAAGASAFAPAAKSNKVSVLNSVWDDYVGGVDLRGQKFEFDPVRIHCFRFTTTWILWLGLL
jgi:hypothetical protein